MFFHSIYLRLPTSFSHTSAATCSSHLQSTLTGTSAYRFQTRALFSGFSPPQRLLRFLSKVHSSQFWEGLFLSWDQGPLAELQWVFSWHHRHLFSMLWWTHDLCCCLRFWARGHGCQKPSLRSLLHAFFSCLGRFSQFQSCALLGLFWASPKFF